MIHKVISYIKKHRDIVSYIAFGILTTVINWGVFFFSRELLKISATASNIIAWVISVLFAFLTNKPFVFNSKNWSREVVIPEFIKFVTCRIGSGVFETVFLFITVDCINLNGTVLKLIASGVAMVLNYILGKYIAFKDSK